MRSVLIYTSLLSLICSWLASRCSQRSPSQQRFPWATKRANSKRANHGRSRLFQDAVSSVSFWLRSFPVHGWRTRSLSSVSGLPTRWRCVRGWLMRLLWAYEHDFAVISPFVLKGLAPSAATRARFSGLSREPPAGALGDLRVTVRASPPGMPSQISNLLLPRVLSPPPHRTQIWRPCLPGQPWISGWRSTDLAAGWLVSWSGAQLTTALCSGAFFPGGAWGADEVMDGLFHNQKPLVHLLRPHYPRRRAARGTRAFPSGESGRGATVSAKRRHLEETSASPVQSL